MTAIKVGYPGRNTACFDQGVFYRYAESSDGEPLWPKGDPIVVHQPESYRPPKRGMSSKVTIVWANYRNLHVIHLFRGAL